MRRLIIVSCVLFSAAGIGSLAWESFSARKDPPVSVAAPVPAPDEPAPVVPVVSQKEPLASFSVPILMYHYIRAYADPADPIGTNLSVSPGTLERHLRFLADQGYQAVGTDYLLRPVRLERRPVLLTFDDGYQDAFTDAFPLLKRYGFSATFYIIVNKVGTPGYLTWDEIREMRAGGMRIGSHTLSHPDLAEIPAASAAAEISESKRLLERELGTPLSDFCYPSGKHDAAVEHAVREAGYATAVTTAGGFATERSDLLALPRKRVTENADLRLLLSQ